MIVIRYKQVFWFDIPMNHFMEMYYVLTENSTFTVF